MNASPTNGHRQPRGTAPVAPRTLPHNLTHEASILGGILLKPELIEQLQDIETNTFYERRHQIVWEAMRNLQAARVPIDVATVEREIEKAGKLEAIGGISFLGELALRVPTAENVMHYAAEARLMQRNRLAILALGEALERAYNWQHDPGELIAEIGGELGRLEYEGKAIGGTQRLRWSGELAAFLGDEEPDDDDAIDWIVRDLIPRAEPFLIGGPMKAGKTWSAIDLAISVALGEKWLNAFENTLGPARVQLVLLEDNERRVRKRLWELCRARNITPYDGRILANLRITRASLHLPDANAQRRFVTEMNTWRPSVIIIDNLTRVLQGDPNSTKDAAAFARAWVDICEQTGAAVGFLHHTKKPSGDQKGVDPFDTLRGSGDFGAAARNIVVITPLRSEGELMSEVRMRGNLDLRRDSFVLGFERKHLLDRWRAQISDRGDVQNAKIDLSKKAKDRKATEKQRELHEENERRRGLALKICEREGGVTQARLSLELGLKSSNSCKPIIDGLVQSNVLTYHSSKKRYVFVDEEPTQGALDIALEQAQQEAP